MLGTNPKDIIDSGDMTKFDINSCFFISLFEKNEEYFNKNFIYVNGKKCSYYIKIKSPMSLRDIYESTSNTPRNRNEMIDDRHISEFAKILSITIVVDIAGRPDYSASFGSGHKLHVILDMYKNHYINLGDKQ